MLNMLLIKAFVREMRFDFSEMACNQLLCLWTAFCIVRELCVDTYAYDTRLRDLWSLVEEKRKRMGADVRRWTSFDEFDAFMCQHLV